MISGKTVALIQARMNSTRFPGKMLHTLGKYPLLECVIRRVKKAKQIDTIVLTTSTLSASTPLAVLAERLGINVFRGSESDVLGRLSLAAERFQADSVLRICADNPLVEPDELDRLVKEFQSNKCDYACNHQDRLGSKYTDGFGAEILTNDLLQKVASLAKISKHREHATLYIWDNKAKFKIFSFSAPPELSFPKLRFDVDTPEDLVKLNDLIANRCPLDLKASEIVRLKQKSEKIVAI